MQVKLTKSGCTLIREPGDPCISHESTVGYRMKLLLNAMTRVETFQQGEEFIAAIPSIMPIASKADVTGGAFPVETAAVSRYTKGEPVAWRRLQFVRLNPSRHGLTSCKVGLIDRKANIVLWHERYAIENAATGFNRGKVFFQRVDAVGAGRFFSLIYGGIMKTVSARTTKMKF